MVPAAGVVAGHYDAVIAGGVESMSRTPMGASLANGGNPYSASFKSRYTRTPNQGVGAEMMATKWGLSRTDLDQYSLDSHEKAAAAQDSGAFDDQIVAIKFLVESRFATREESVARFLGEFDEAVDDPGRAVAILAAVLAHARRITFDITGRRV